MDVAVADYPKIEFLPLIGDEFPADLSDHTVSYICSRKQVTLDNACVIDCLPGCEAKERSIVSDIEWSVTCEYKPKRPPPTSPIDNDDEANTLWITIPFLLVVIGVVVWMFVKVASR